MAAAFVQLSHFSTIMGRIESQNIQRLDVWYLSVCFFVVVFFTYIFVYHLARKHCCVSSEHCSTGRSLLQCCAKIGFLYEGMIKPLLVLFQFYAKLRHLFLMSLFSHRGLETNACLFGWLDFPFFTAYPKISARSANPPPPKKKKKKN